MLAVHCDGRTVCVAKYSRAEVVALLVVLRVRDAVVVAAPDQVLRRTPVVDEAVFVIVLGGTACFYFTFVFYVLF